MIDDGNVEVKLKLLSSSVSTKFQQIIEQPFEEDPGINIGHITVSHNGHVIMLSGFKGYKVKSFCMFFYIIYINQSKKKFEIFLSIQRVYDTHMIKLGVYHAMSVHIINYQLSMINYQLSMINDQQE